MKISARNQIQGTIIDITKGATTSHVRLDVGGGAIIRASITNESVDETARAFVAAGARARARAGRGSLQVVVLDLIV
ncbi:MAG: TOBE domain-containing protein, partial [Roseiarcus sp.]